MTVQSQNGLCANPPGKIGRGKMWLNVTPLKSFSFSFQQEGFIESSV